MNASLALAARVVELEQALDAAPHAFQFAAAGLWVGSWKRVQNAAQTGL
jgi:hypothetical protein